MRKKKKQVEREREKKKRKLSKFEKSFKAISKT